MLALATIPRPVESVGLDGVGTCAPNGYQFAFSGIGWIQGQADLRYGLNTPFNARAWIQQWTAVRDVDGSQLQMTEAWGEIVVTFEDLSGPPAALGRASCAQGFVQIDDRYRMNATDGNLANEMRGVLLHEVGHTLGLAHVGPDASSEGAFEALETCRSSAARQQAVVSSDDRAGYLFQNSGGNDGDVSPNPGFESGSYAWSAFGGMSVTIHTTGGRTGPQRVRLRQTISSAGSYQQWVRISDNNQRTVDAEVWVRALSGSPQFGRSYANVYFTARTYGPDGCGNYPSGRNERNITSTGTTTLISSRNVQAVSGSWREVQTTPAQLPADSGLVQLQLRNTQRYIASGTWASVYSDDVSIRLN